VAAGSRPIASLGICHCQLASHSSAGRIEIREHVDADKVLWNQKPVSLTVSEIFNGECDAMVSMTLNDL